MSPTKPLLISIVTPTYNESVGIVNFVKTVERTMQKVKLPFEIIVVDDNSPDGTADIVLKLKTQYPTLKLLKRAGKLGIGSAYFDGFNLAKGDIIIGIDADLSPSSEVIPLFIQQLTNQFDMVIGSRYLWQSKVKNVSFFKSFGSRVFNYLTRLMLSLPYTDITHSNRAFTRKGWQLIAPKINSQDHPSFFIECSFWAHKLGLKVTEIPINFTERIVGQSKLNVKKGLKSAWQTVKKLRIRS